MTETNRYRHFAHQRNAISTVTSSCVVCFRRKAFIACTLSLKPSECPHTDWLLNWEGVIVLLSCYAPSRQEHGFCGSHWRHTYNFLTLGGLSPVMCIFFLHVCAWVSDEPVWHRHHHSSFQTGFLCGCSCPGHMDKKLDRSRDLLVLNCCSTWWNVDVELMIKNPLSTSGV